jgi:hypothetical protein
MRDLILIFTVSVFITALIVVAFPISQTCIATSPPGPRIAGVMLIAGCP